MVQQQLTSPRNSPGRAISPYLELGAYEKLWSEQGATFKRIADKFRLEPDALPSDFVTREDALEMAEWVVAYFKKHGVDRPGITVHHSGEYPKKLRDARHPLELLTYQGIWNLVEAPSVAVVGSRKASPEGIARARKLARHLVRDGYTVVSGLAAGIDTAAHHAALDEGGNTVAVIGTPLGAAYPKENTELQQRIARDHLLISQVPAYRYSTEGLPFKRTLFPERNATMSAISLATVIVEASNTSGSLVQGRAALQQRRKLFIMDNCFRNPELTWPNRLEKQGAIRIREYAEIPAILGQARASDPN